MNFSNELIINISPNLKVNDEILKSLVSDLLP